MNLSDLLVLWGKARPPSDELPSAYHPLLCHMADVAVVARTMWRHVLPAAARERIAAALGLRPDVAERWIAFWAGLHDLGKASPIFQSQQPAAWKRTQAAGFTGQLGVLRTPHGTITAGALPTLLTGGRLGLPHPVAQRIATVLGGHHGTFPPSRDVQTIPTSNIGGDRWKQARRALVDILADALEVPSNSAPERIDNAAAMILAGLVSVADWIGSNTGFFRYAVSDGTHPRFRNLREYVRSVEPEARRALDELGWTGWSPPDEPRPFTDLFPFPGGANPLQQRASALAETLDSPALVIVEAATGEGKTEAALYLADTWAARFGQRGCYVALPTQATSNQMFSRVRQFLAGRYPRDQVNLQLLHGHAALSAEFELLRRRAEQPGSARDRFATFELSEIYDEGGYDRAPASVIAAEWFTHRKRGLLAPFGVGTVDQALLAVLQTRHVFVRLFGLAHKTVIVDEVHAYDTYMTALLERLLEWLAALGTAVVLLSATLPRDRRDRLARAYARGLGRPEAATLAVPYEPYPRITWISPARQGAHRVETSARSRKTVELTWIEGQLPETESAPFPLGQRLRVALRDGGCAAVICNTVNRAQQVYLALKPYFPDQADDGWPELDLLHARYLFEDRDAREKRALRRFGKPGATVQFADRDERTVRRPHRAVLVATQIVEQSLDLDFDLLVSDLAPADLVLQRLGRLHRHPRWRPPGLSRPALWLCRPEEDAEGAPRFGRGDEAVYNAHVLLRSWLALRDHHGLVIPDDVEALVEGVYDNRPCPAELSPVLRDRWDQTTREVETVVASDQEEAKSRWIKPVDYEEGLWRLAAEPREEDAPEFHRAHQALTRLAEPSVTVVCLYGRPERPCLDREGRHALQLNQPPNLALAARLLRRSVALTDRRIVWDLLERQPPASWSRSPLLRNVRLLTFASDYVTAVGKHRLRVDVELGVILAE